MSGLAAIVAGRHEPGVFRWHAHFTPQEVAHTAEMAGWSAAYVDGWTRETQKDVVTAIGESLGLPDQGGNLDGLLDSLRDVKAPTVLLWDGWGPFAHQEPEAFEQVLRGLSDRVGDGTPFTVLLRGEGPEVDVPSLD